MTTADLNMLDGSRAEQGEQSRTGLASTGLESLGADVSLAGVSPSFLLKRLLLFRLYSRNSLFNPGYHHFNVTD